MSFYNTDSLNLGDELETFMNSSVRMIEIDHQHILFGPANTTLAWKIIPGICNCTTSQILSYVSCQLNDPIVNIEMIDTRVIVSLDSLQLKGELIDFDISTLSAQSRVECQNLSEIVIFNGNSIFELHQSL